MPGIPSAEEIASDGHHLGDVQVRMLEKIEELTLHLISMNEEVKKLKNQLKEMEVEIETLNSNEGKK